MERENRKLQYFSAFVVSLAAITAGASFSWCTPVLPKLHANETNIDITESQISWVAAMSSPGFMTGSLATRFASDNLGRRGTLLASAVPITIGAIFMVSSTYVWALYIGRILCGFSSGMIVTVSAMYLTEIADKEIRGSLGSTSRLMFNFASFLVMSIGPFISYQTLNYMFLALPVCYFIACWWIPETPYYYLKESQVNDARRALKRLTNCKDEILEERLSQMRSDVNKQMSRSGSLKELLSGQQYRKALIISVGLKITQIMSGSMAIAQYLGRITQESESGLNVSTVLIIFGAVQFTVGVMSSVLVDRLGRRPLLIYSFFGSGLCLSVVAFYFFRQEVLGLRNQHYLYGFIPFIGIIMSNISRTLGYGSVAYIIPAEIFPINVKSVGMTLINILGGLCAFTAAKSFQPLKNLVGLCGVFGFFASVSFIGALFTFVFLPETKGKSLREIQVELQGELYYETVQKFNEVVSEEIKEKESTELTEISTQRKEG